MIIKKYIQECSFVMYLDDTVILDEKNWANFVLAGDSKIKFDYFETHKNKLTNSFFAVSRAILTKSQLKLLKYNSTLFASNNNFQIKSFAFLIKELVIKNKEI